MTNTNTTARTAAEIAIARCTRKIGATAASLHNATGWARRPTTYDLGQLAARHGYKLTLLTNKSGATVYRFV